MHKRRNLHHMPCHFSCLYWMFVRSSVRTHTWGESPVFFLLTSTQGGVLHPWYVSSWQGVVGGFHPTQSRPPTSSPPFTQPVHVAPGKEWSRGRDGLCTAGHLIPWITHILEIRPSWQSCIIFHLSEKKHVPSRITVSVLLSRESDCLPKQNKAKAK